MMYWHYKHYNGGRFVGFRMLTLKNNINLTHRVVLRREDRMVFVSGTNVMEI